MKKIILFFAIIIFSKSISGQVSVGLSIGDNLCKIKKTADYESNPYLIKPDKEEYLLTNGFTIGIPVEINFSEKLSLFTQISYLQRGSKVKSSMTTFDDNISKIEGYGKYNYFELPIQVKFYFLKNKLNGFLLVGPSFGYLINGKAKYDISEYDVQQGTTSYDNLDVKFKSSEIKDAGLNRLDISIFVGLGLDYNFGVGKIYLNLNYLHGITDMANDDQEVNNGINLYHRGLITTLGYLIPLTKKN